MMSKAPSEKHLEDWIVAYPELFADYGGDEDEDLSYRFTQHIIARQVSIPSGRVDLLAFREVLNCSPLTLSVIELKKDALNYTVMAQCLKYIHELREIYNETFMDFTFGLGVPFTLRYEIDQYPFNSYEPVTGILVGHSIPDEGMVTIAAAANISLITYKYYPEENYYAFTEHTPFRLGSSEDYERLSQGVIGDAMRELMRRCAARFPAEGGVQS